MKFTKQQVNVLRKEHARLQRRMKLQDKQNLKFAKTKCKNLLRCLNQRWDYDIDQLFEEEAYTRFEYIMHDLRND